MSASQHRKAVREGKIEDRAIGRQRSADSRRIQNPKPEARSLFRSGIDFARAMTSGPASEELKAKRLAVCRGPCPTDQREEVGDYDYCKACHCPNWRFARLDNKAGLALDTCTEGHWKELKIEE